MFSLRMSFAFGRPSCELALRYVWAPNLRTCLALRWGAQLADVRTCLAFVLRTYLVLRWSVQLADVPCFALGQPTLVRLY
jgi:hypothetical protein